MSFDDDISVGNLVLIVKEIVWVYSADEYFNLFLFFSRSVLKSITLDPVDSSSMT